MKNKRNRISKQELWCISTITIIMLLFEWWIGVQANINIWVLITYFAYMVYLSYKDLRFFVEFSWFIITASMNVMGVFACESREMWLNEISTTSSYKCALTPLVLAMILFFFIIEMRRIKNAPRENKIQKNIVNTKEDSSQMVMIMSIAGFGLLLIAFFMARNTPLFKIGIDRVTYQRTYISTFATMIKRNLPLFVPAVLLYMRKNKWFGIAFFFVLFAYYFWTGDKFGTYLQIGYIAILLNSGFISGKSIKRGAKVIVLLVIALLAIVYIQRGFMNGGSFDGFWTYISERLAQQGQVWWSVYSKYIGKPAKVGELLSEFNVINPFYSGNEYFGQWKMELIAADYSGLSQYRVSIGHPLAATTTASIYYFLKYPGVLLFYAIAAFFYEKLIRTGICMMKRNRLVISMITVKVIILYHNLLGASDIGILSWKSMIFVMAFIILSKYKMIIFGKRNRGHQSLEKPANSF